MDRTRRGFLRDGSLLAAGGAGAAPGEAGAAAAGELVRIDPAPLFELSPWLQMQFMEPLGVTDSAVAAAWDDDAGDWRRDFLAAVADLAPGMIRYGGLFSRGYRWREGVGPPGGRPSRRNHAWGGLESNRVGTGEFVALCRRVGAEPLLCVNFLSDGHAEYARTAEGSRTADAGEAAAWVAYCNDPDSPERRAHGVTEPYGVRFWQLGNETSYGQSGFTREAAIARTIEFAKAMRARDPGIRLIGWGDRGDDGELWAGEMLRRAGEHLDLIAIHMMQQLPSGPGSVLRGNRYQAAPERAWDELMAMVGRNEARLLELEQVLDGGGFATGIAVTEGHLSLPPHNANPLLLEWLTGVYHARMLNLYRRHGRRVRIATVADFNGSRWTVVAVRLPVPHGRSYLTPAGAVMRLFGRHAGSQAVAVATSPTDLDIAASRTGEHLYLHLANLSCTRPLAVRFAVEGRTIAAGRVREIAPDDLRQAASEDEPDVFAPVERVLLGNAWTLPKAAVSVVELDLA